jgi:hypothetical protein
VNEARTDIKGGYAYIGVGKMAKVWLICNTCGYNTEVLENEVMDFDKCAICGGNMVLDLNAGRKLESATGDNFPTIPATEKENKSPTNTQRLMINALAQEIRDFGEEQVWNNLNTIPIDKRMDYLELFLSAKKLLEKGEY